MCHYDALRNHEQWGIILMLLIITIFRILIILMLLGIIIGYEIDVLYREINNPFSSKTLGIITEINLGLLLLDVLSFIDHVTEIVRLRTKPKVVEAVEEGAVEEGEAVEEKAEVKQNVENRVSSILSSLADNESFHLTDDVKKRDSIKIVQKIGKDIIDQINESQLKSAINEFLEKIQQSRRPSRQLTSLLRNGLPG